MDGVSLKNFDLGQVTLLRFKMKDIQARVGLLVWFHSKLNHDRGCEVPPFVPASAN